MHENACERVAVSLDNKLQISQEQLKIPSSYTEQINMTNILTNESPDFRVFICKLNSLVPVVISRRDLVDGLSWHYAFLLLFCLLTAN